MKRLVVTCTVVVALLASANASAEIYSGSTSFAAPVGIPTLNGPTPDPGQTAEYIDTLSASYDNQSGTVTLNFGFYDPGTWGAQFSNGDGGAAASSGALLALNPSDAPQGGIDVYLGNQNQSACEQQDPFPAGPLTAQIISETDDLGNFTGDDIDAELVGFNGDVYEPVSFNGTTFTTTLQNGAFTGHAWNCLVFDGYGLTLNPPPRPPPRLNPWFEGAINQGHPVRPSTLWLSADGTLVVFHVHWSRWGRVAVGKGNAEYHGCTPSCGASPSHHAAVTVNLWDIRDCGGQDYYNKVTVYKRHGKLPVPYQHWAPC